MNNNLDNKVKKQIIELISNNSNLTNFSEIHSTFKDIQATLIQNLLEKERDIFLEDNPSNKKNGYSCKNKKVKTPVGDIFIDMPRDRDSLFDPLIIKKRQRVMKDFSELAILLYSKGNSLNDIKEIIKNMYSVELSNTFISRLISKVSTDLEIWKQRQLKPLYTFMMVDCIYCNVKIDSISTKVAVYVIIGIDIKGIKEIVGLWISDGSESASFWALVFEDLKTRGVEDILYISMDGLKGLAEAVEEIYPFTKMQRCIVHLVRNLYNICNKKEAKTIINDYKKIYTSSSENEAIEYFNEFVKKYQDKKIIIKKVNEHITHILPLFDETKEIRKIIYTTNAIESVNSSLRKVTRGKGTFINKQSLFRVLYLRIQDLETKWSKGTHNWDTILNSLIEKYGSRITNHIMVTSENSNL